jgi:hypothetical protein
MDSAPFLLMIKVKTNPAEPEARAFQAAYGDKRGRFST